MALEKLLLKKHWFAGNDAQTSILVELWRDFCVMERNNFEPFLIRLIPVVVVVVIASLERSNCWVRKSLQGIPRWSRST